MSKNSILLTGFALAIAASAQAQSTIADWTFQTSAPVTAGPFSPEVGSGSALGSHVGAAAYSSPAGNGSSHSFSANTWAVGDYYQVQVSTAGYTGISLSFDQTSSTTGPSLFQLQYSTDGTTFMPIGSDYSVAVNGTPNTAWNATTASSVYTLNYNLSTATADAVENDSSLYLRFVDDSTVAENAGTVAATGTDRMDNILVQGTSAVPEPSAIALLAMGGAAFVGRFRRFKK
jgi:hypothetical protein